jgi:ribonucleoside-diphosphate reductase alpha chain
MGYKTMRKTIHTAMDMLTNVSDATSIQNVPSIEKANRELHSVGLGAMNLHGYLAKNHMMYESFEARDFARTFFMMMNFYSLERSMQISKETGVTFAGFEKSAYADGSYFDRYTSIDYAPQSEKAKNLFKGMDIPSPQDWEKLKRDVQKYGVYNAYRQAIAPTGSISYVQNATAAVMPIMEMVEERKDAKAKTYYPMPFLNESNMWFYKSAYNMDPYKMIDMVAIIQEHIDQGISTTLFVQGDCSTRDLAKLYIYAHHKGLKGLYYTRQQTARKIDAQECVNCSV